MGPCISILEIKNFATLGVLHALSDFTLAKNAKHAESHQPAPTFADWAGLARKTQIPVFDLPPGIRSGRNQYAVAYWTLGEWGLEGMRVMGEAVEWVVALSAVGFHFIQPNLR